MNDWKEVKPIYRRSEKKEPFCPFCGGELNSLRLINDTDSCKCGEWTESGEFKILYRPNEEPTK